MGNAVPAEIPTRLLFFIFLQPLKRFSIFPVSWPLVIRIGQTSHQH